MAVFNNALTINEAGLDQIVNSSRNRGTVSNPLGVNYLQGVGTPVSLAPAGTQTLTAAQLGTGIVTIAPSVANTTTLDTAANIVAYFNQQTAGAVVGDYMCVLLINGTAATGITLAAGTNGGFDGNNANRTIGGATSKYCYIRLTNVTPGSEAYTVYF